MKIIEKYRGSILGKIIFLIASSFVFLLMFVAGYKYQGGWKYDNVKIFYVILSVLLFGILIFNIIYTNRFKWKVQNIFFINAIVIGFIMTMTIPVYAVPDETAHLWTAYNVSNGMLGETVVDETQGVYMRTDDEQEHLKNKKYGNKYLNNYYARFNDKLENEEMIQTVFPPLDTYSYQYYVSAAGLTVGRILKLGTLPAYMLGRGFNYIFFVLLVYFSIRIIPFGKSAIAVLSLFPMTVQQMFSYSYDAFIVPVSILIISITLYFCYEKKQRHKKILYIILMAAVLLLLPTKGKAYFPVCLFPLLILFKNRTFIIGKIAEFRKKNKKIFNSVCVGIGLLFLLAAGLIIYKFTAIIADTSSTNYIEWAEEEGYTLGYLLRNPGMLVKIFINTLYVKGDMYFFSFIGYSLGWFDINIPFILILPFFVFLIMTCIRKENENVFIGKYTKLCMNILAIISFLCICFGMLLEWTPISDTYIQGVQGRYFIPFALLPVLTIRSKKLVITEGVEKFIFYTMPYIYFVIFTYIITYVYA